MNTCPSLRVFLSSVYSACALDVILWSEGLQTDAQLKTYLDFTDHLHYLEPVQGEVDKYRRAGADGKTCPRLRSACCFKHVKAVVDSA